MNWMYCLSVGFAQSDECADGEYSVCQEFRAVDTRRSTAAEPFRHGILQRRSGLFDHLPAESRQTEEPLSNVLDGLVLRLSSHDACRGGESG
jgi:hypothetical protein